MRALESTTVVPTLAVLSLAAGLLHAAVVSAHRGHGVAATVFIGIAIFQVSWAALAPAWPTRLMVSVGALANALIVGGYLLTRTSGIPFIDGFQDAETVGFTDAITTLFEVVLVVGAAQVLFAGSARLSWPSGRAGAAGFGAVGLAAALVGVPAAVAAPAHHDHGQLIATAAGHSHAGQSVGVATTNLGAHDHGAASTPESVTPEQRAAADKLIADAKAKLPQWADSAKAEAAGFRSIGDGVTGNEHLINWAWINDSTVLDPDHPESLVYRPTPTGRVLEAAMYMVPVGTADNDLPDLGGTLTQWHIHNNLCMSAERIVNGAPQRSVIAITTGDGSCATGEKLPTTQMLHVWIVPNRCGPFSALEGIGGGQKVLEAQDPNAEPSCQHSH